MLLESICFVWTIISGIEIFLIGVTVKYIYIYIFFARIIYQMKKRFNSNLQNTFSLKSNFRCETAVRHIIKMEQFFGKLEHHQKNRDNIQTTSTIFNVIKVVNLETPQTHDVISTSIRRRIDVETTSCVYRETLGVNIYSFNSKLYKFLSFSFL